MKKVFSVIFASVLMVQTVMADNLDNALSAWKSLYANVQGYTYNEIPASTVSTFDQWKNSIYSAYNDLSDSITLNIKNFDASVYDLKYLESYDVAISAKGRIESEYSTVTYFFDYNPNFKMIRVCENRSLYNKLTIEEKQVFTSLNNVVNQIKRTSFSDYEKELAIHDFIVSNYKYGPAYTDNVPQRAHSIVGIVTDGEGICEAYANTFQLMCKLAGIDSQIITGEVNGVGHMWNIVNIDGDYYHVDVTSDDPYPDVEGRQRYNFFNVTDDMISINHTWERDNYPKCTATIYNYQIYNNYVVTSYEDLEKLLTDGLSKSKTYFTFKTEGYIINDASDIRKILSNKGFSKISITGEYGKDGIFNLTLE